ncbi:MAG: hypothetical protein Q4B72_13345 [Lachnospiraceae bacterium]|nr:hypothetical protein [Lachnospiraceae bacterium]
MDAMYLDTPARVMTEEAMRDDLNYRMAQDLTKQMLENGLISLSEYDKITALNKKKFRPFLAELLD